MLNEPDDTVGGVSTLESWFGRDSATDVGVEQSTPAKPVNYASLIATAISGGAFIALVLSVAVSGLAHIMSK